MTAEELLERVAPHRLISHWNSVFFQTRDPEELLRWQELGAHTRGWYSEGQLADANHRRGEHLPQGYEIQVLPLLDPVWVTDEEGNERNVAADQLRELIRGRREQ